MAAKAWGLVTQTWDAGIQVSADSLMQGYSAWLDDMYGLQKKHAAASIGARREAITIQSFAFFNAHSYVSTDRCTEFYSRRWHEEFGPSQGSIYFEQLCRYR